MIATFLRAALLGTLLFTGTAYAQDKLSNADREFMMDAARDGMAEVQLGKIAQQNASNSMVKDFGQRMIADHGKANSELQSLAKKLGVTLPKEPSEKHKQESAKLSKVKGAEFDSQYSRHMVEEHEKDVALFRRQAKEAQNTELRQWAGQTLPVLEKHLEMARSLTKGSEKK